MAKNLDVTLGTVSVDSSDTDEILLEKAKAQLPNALRKVGEAMGEEAWKTFVQGLGNSPFIQIDKSIAAQSKFVREAADEFVRDASESDKASLTQTILDQLTPLRDAERAKKVSRSRRPSC